MPKKAIYELRFFIFLAIDYCVRRSKVWNQVTWVTGRNKLPLLTNLSVNVEDLVELTPVRSVRKPAVRSASRHTRSVEWPS